MVKYKNRFYLIIILFSLIIIKSNCQIIDEGFEGSFPPVGWIVSQNNCGSEVYWWQTNGEYDVCGGEFSALILGSDIICGTAEDWLITPQLAPTNDNKIFSFLSHQSYFQEHGSIYTLRVSTSSATNLNDFNIFYSWNESQMPTNCTQMNFDMGTFVGDSIYIAFVMENDAGDNWIIDNVSGLPLVGNCYPPTGMQTFDVISTSAGLKWDSIDTVPKYFWEVVPKGNEQGINVVVSDFVLDSFDIATPLQLSTDYDYRVKSVCNSGANSYFSTPYSFSTLGAPPINDNCVDAISININLDNDCDNILNTTNLDATKSMEACQGIANDDVWYSFVASSEKHEIQILNVTAVKGLSIDIIHEVFSGDCNSLSSILCNDANISTLTGLNIGEKYYLRIYSKYNTSNQSFDLCIKTPPPSPVNDNCDFATLIQVNSDDNCTSIFSESTVGATQSFEGCKGIADDDVWFRFVANSVKHSFIISNVSVVEGNNADMVHEVFSGNCANLVSMKCSDPNSSAVTGLVVGEEYFVRIYSKYNTSRQDFDFCIKTPPIPPINDICELAIDINVGEFGSCLSNKILCSTLNATNTKYGSCDSSGDDPDLWYKFSVPKYGDYYFNSIRGNPGMTLYKGSCNNLTEIECLNNISGTLLNLSPDTLYFVKIYTDFAMSEVEFCIEKDISPENNYSNGAILLDLGQGYCNDLTIGNNHYATNSFIVSPNCGNYLGGDLWYKFIVPLSGDVEIEMSRIGSFIDGAMAVYSGDNDNLSLIDCDDNSNSNIGTSNMPYLYLPGQTPGDTLYIRVWENGNNVIGDFSICAWEPNDLVISLGGDCQEGLGTIINKSLGNIYTWVPLKDDLGNIIAFVYPNGNELGNTVPTIFTRDVLPLRVDENGIPYINRDIEVSVENQPGINKPLVRLIYNHGELNDLLISSSNINIIGDMNMTKSEVSCNGSYSQQGGYYSQISNLEINSNGDSYLQFQIPSFSTFYIHGGLVALPLEILNFSGESIENVNSLKWYVNENNQFLDSLILEKSKNGIKSWGSIYKSSEFKNGYGSFLDKYPYNESFYRIKMISVEGVVSYSRILSINHNTLNNFVNIFPNPSSGNISIKTNMDLTKDFKALIYSAEGNVIRDLNINSKEFINSFLVDLSDVKSGIYYLKLFSSQQNIIKKFVITK